MNKKLLFTSLFVISMLLASGIGPRLTASAESATVPTITSDLPDYAAGATVTLTGAGWAPAEAVHIFVNDDLGLTWSHNSNPDPVADGSGGFTYRFQLPTWFVATYRVTATGPNSGTATTTFTDAPPSVENLWQCDPPTGYLSTYDCATSSATGWGTGNDDGPFFEGETVPYRTRLQNMVSGNDYSITIEWDTTKGGKHALDYLRTYNATITGADPCASLTGLPAGLCSGTVSTFAIPPDTVMQADANWIANAGTQLPGEFTMFGGTLTGVGPTYTTPAAYTGDTSTSITVFFTANNTDIVLAWGGHIAERADWGLDNAAVSISGSPYHMRILSWYDVSNSTGLNVGNTDRSLSADAVIYPASITIIKDATPEGSTSFPFTASPAPLAAFNLVDDGVPASYTKLFDKIINFTTYTVSETVPTGWTLDGISCSVTSPNGGSYSVTLPGVDIVLKEGENWTCTFTDEMNPVSPAISTTPNPTSGTVGVTLNDSATLSGGYSPTGKITFKLFGPSDATCTGAPLYTEEVTVNGNGSYPTTTGYVTDKAGTYRWTASYDGDLYNNAASSGCNDEQVAVAKAKPSITTVASPAGDIVVGTATTVGDTATLTNGYNPTGSVTFTLYSDATCQTAVSGVSGSGSITSGTASYSTSWTPGTIGTYYWIATYAGDDNNDGFTTGCGDANEQLTVVKAPLTVTTSVHNASHMDKTNLHVPLGSIMHDTASVTGAVGSIPLPAVSFKFFENGTCTGDGTAIANDATPAPDTLASIDTSALSPGSYAFQATVATDDHYTGDVSECEPFTVDKAQLAISTTVHDATHTDITNTHVPLGTVAHDNADVTGAVAGFPIPAITFTFNGDPIAKAASAEAGFDATTIDTEALDAGSYTFVASVAGDSNYLGATSADEPFTVDGSQLEVTTAVHDAAHVDKTTLHVPLGSIMHDTASVTGGIPGFELPAVSFTFFTNNTCEGSSTPYANDATPTPDTLASVDTDALAAGFYAFQATVASSANYIGDTSECEPFTVDKAQLAITTTVHDATHADITNTHVPLGTIAHDNADVTGTVSGFPIPGISFTLNSNPIGNAASPEAGFEATSINTVALAAGSYTFQATVAGNSNYLGATSALEPFTVDKKQLTVTTLVHNASHVDKTNLHVPLGSIMHDTATVTGGVNGFSLPGVSFVFFSNNTCEGSSAPYANDVAPAPDSLASVDTSPLAAGSYAFQATVAGDDNYLSDVSECEPFTVDKKQLTVTTTVHNAAHTDITNTHMVLGTIAHDNATVTGAVSGFPIPGISFLFDGSSIANAAAAELGFDATSIDTAALGAGDHVFSAAVAGNDNYIGDSSDPEPFTVDKKQLAITTVVHDASHVDITNQNVPLGTVAHDNAAVTGAVSGFPIPAISFTLNSSPIANAAAAEVGFDATTIDTAALGAGNYIFVATVAGNDNYLGAASANEPFTVDKKQLTVTTAVHNAAHVDKTNLHVPVGSIMHDTAGVTGGLEGFTVPGVTFTFFTNGTCAGDGAPIANEADPTPDALASIDTAALDAGSYAFKAAVPGSSNYLGDFSDCEPFMVDQAWPSIVTSATDATGASTTISDSATLSGGYNPTGTITFKLYGPSATPSCTSTNLLFTSSPVTVSGNGTHGPVSFSPLAVGKYYWIASYSGDANNDAVSGACGDTGETSTVNPGYASVVKTVAGQPPASDQIFTFQLRKGASITSQGTILETVNTDPSGLINFTTQLVPGKIYQLCELVFPGWSTNLAGDGPLFVPGSMVTPTLPNPNVDNVTVCTNFSVSVDQTRVFTVDNTPPPGGRALTIGFWKNWASCAKSNNKKTWYLDLALGIASNTATNPTGGLVLAADGGTWPSYAPLRTLVLHGVPTSTEDLIVKAPDCALAVKILNKTSSDGVKRAKDPLFNMAAQLLAAQLNRFMGADITNTTISNMDKAVLLLGKYDFDGLYPYGSPLHPTLTAADKAKANCLARQLDNYNNNRPVYACP